MAAEQTGQAPVQETAPPPATSTVVVHDGLYDARKDDTASRIVVSKDDLARYGDISLLEALKRVPGLSVAGKSVIMRGLGSGYTQILVDGERAPSGFSLDTLSPQSIERIEIIRSAVAEYSTQGIAGTINVILTKKASNNSTRIRAALGAAHGNRWPGASLTYSDKSPGRQSTLNLEANEARFRTPSHFVEQIQDRFDHLLSQSSAAAISDGVYRSLSGNGRINWNLSSKDSMAWQTYGSVAQTTSSMRRDTVVLQGTSVEFPSIRQQGDAHEGTVKSDVSYTRALDDGKLNLKASIAHAQSVNDWWVFRRNVTGHSGRT